MISGTAADSENGARTVSGRKALLSQPETILWKRKIRCICNFKQFFFTYLGNITCSLTSPCGLNSYIVRSMSKTQFCSSNSSHSLCSCLNSLICLISSHQYHFSPLPSSKWEENQAMHNQRNKTGMGTERICMPISFLGLQQLHINLSIIAKSQP